jgi:transcriptional regulator with XRE-family HTH domain
MARTKFPSDLGQILRLARELKGISGRELERQSGVSDSEINHIETGHTREPGFRTVVKLARALGIPIERLANMIGE